MVPSLQSLLKNKSFFRAKTYLTTSQIVNALLLG